MYKVKRCNETYEKHIDQLRFDPDIEAELEVKDTSQLERNLSLHPIPHTHSIEPDQSNQTCTSPALNNTLSDNHTSTSLPQSPNTSVPIEPNIGHINTAIRHKSMYYKRQNKTKL